MSNRSNFRQILDLSKLSGPTPKRLKRATLGCSILILLSLGWEQLPFLRNFEQFWLDYRYSHFNRELKASRQVLLIDIDDSSMKLLGPHFGRWPWPRKIYKNLIEFLELGEPSGIYFDLLFTEASQSDDGDQQVAEISAHARNVSHAILFSGQPSTELNLKSEIVPLPKGFQQKFGLSWDTSNSEGPLFISNSSLKDPVFRDFNLPTQTLLQKIPSIHSVTSEKDSDGVYRRTPLLFHYDSGWYPSLALKAVADWLKTPHFSFHENSIDLQNDQKIHYSIPLDSKGMLPLHFYRSDRDIEIIPIAAALSSASRLQSGEISDPTLLQINPLTLKDKVIVIGASAEGLFDLKSTPISSAYPGSLLHATAISNILNQDFVSFPPVVMQTLLTCSTIILIYFSIFLIQPLLIKVALPLIWLGSYSAISFLLFQKYSLAFEIARPFGLGFFAIIDGLLYLIFIEGKDKKKLRETLSKYLPPSVTDRIIATGQNPRAEVGQQKELSILFSDIRGFTTLSEKLSPQELVSILNQYLGRMTDVIFDETGTLDKFIGDAIMAFWGAPIPDSDHALKSVRCAIKMKSTLKELNQEWSQKGLSPLQIGIGINTGSVIVGNIGSEKRLDYTVIGDNVNLASRLETLTKQYGLELLIGDRTAHLIKDSIICRPIDFVTVKGKNHPIKVYEPLCEISDPLAKRLIEFSEIFSKALSNYQNAQFEIALAQFKTASEIFKNEWNYEDSVGILYIERCKKLILNPPQSGWTGIFIAQEK